jgi:hypothetical protein
MPIIREFRCNSCGHDFERIRPECPLCHCDARRVFLTPPHISNGYAKRTDAILQNQFDKLGISNFSNSQGPGAPNRVTWKPRKFGSRASGGQPEINPMLGADSLKTIGMNQIMQTLGPGETVPYAVPKDIGAGIPMGVPIGGRPTELLKHTRVVGRLDSDGRSVQRVG